MPIFRRRFPAKSNKLTRIARAMELVEPIQKSISKSVDEKQIYMARAETLVKNSEVKKDRGTRLVMARLKKLEKFSNKRTRQAKQKLRERKAKNKIRQA